MHAITQSGWIEVISGSMFSGKTEELLRRLRRAEIAGQEISVFKPQLDDRYGETTVGSHAGRSWEASVVPSEGEGVWQIAEELNGEDVVAIDEANFFSAELVDVCEALAADGKRVVVSGTDQTFRAEPFDPLPQTDGARRVRRQAAGHLHPLRRAGHTEPATHRRRARARRRPHYPRRRGGVLRGAVPELSYPPAD